MKKKMSETRLHIIKVYLKLSSKETIIKEFKLFFFTRLVPVTNSIMKKGFTGLC